MPGILQPFVWFANEEPEREAHPPFAGPWTLASQVGPAQVSQRQFQHRQKSDAYCKRSVLALCTQKRILNLPFFPLPLPAIRPSQPPNYILRKFDSSGLKILYKLQGVLMEFQNSLQFMFQISLCILEGKKAFYFKNVCKERQKNVQTIIQSVYDSNPTR